MDPSDALATFMSITGVDDDAAALAVLQSVDFDLQRALDRHFAAHAIPTDADADTVRSPIPVQGFDMLVDHGIESPQPSPWISVGLPNRVPRSLVPEWLQPPAAALELLPTMTELYAGPVHMNNRGTLDQLRLVAKRDPIRWIVAWISNGSPESMKMRRQVWSHPAVLQVLAGPCLLWARDKSSVEGQLIAQRYRAQTHDTPATLVIDPRTGECVISWNGFMDAENLAENLAAFIEANPTSQPPRVSSVGPKTPAETAPEMLTEDEQLARAMALSLQDQQPQDEQPQDEQPQDETQSNEDEPEAEPVPEEVPDEADAPATPEVVLEEEPDAGPGVVQVQLRLPNQTVKRRFRATDTVESIYGFARFAVPEARKRGFKLIQMPRTELLDLEMTLEDAGLNRASISLKWE